MQDQRDELLKINGSDKLIVCFAGSAKQFGGIVPFEFLNFLSGTYQHKYDMAFYIDNNKKNRIPARYHKGIVGISTDVSSTVEYLNKLISKGNYSSVLFMGVSMGGYAAILFGSLCNIKNVIAFIPRVKCDNKCPAIDKKYEDLRNIINPNTKYILYGDLSVNNKNDPHHILQCEYLEKFNNVTLHRKQFIDMKKIRDSGELKMMIDDVFK